MRDFARKGRSAPQSGSVSYFPVESPLLSTGTYSEENTGEETTTTFRENADPKTGNNSSMEGLDKNKRIGLIPSTAISEYNTFPETGIIVAMPVLMSSIGARGVTELGFTVAGRLPEKVRAFGPIVSAVAFPVASVIA